MLCYVMLCYVCFKFILLFLYFVINLYLLTPFLDTNVTCVYDANTELQTL